MGEGKSKPGRDLWVGAWLILVCVLVYATILVGGATRLTDLGLSITEWKPISGAIPPLSAHDWNDVFTRYQQTTEYRLQNHGMSLADFQTIYWWEWGHRFLDRVIGLAVLVGLVVLGAMGRLKGRWLSSVTLLALIGVEAIVGWWMVTSGLFRALDVSPLRLAIHLGLAFVIIAFALWVALDAFEWPRERSESRTPKWLPAAFLCVLFAQVMFGALLAGARGGPAYPDWPMIGGHWLPPSAFELHPLLRNFVANHATQHLFHRTLGYIVAATALAIAALGQRGPGAARIVAMTLGALALGQACLGIATVLNGAPLALSLTHQAGAAALWLCGVALLRVTVLNYRNNKPL